ncbi:hypothetical protein [Geminocystis herdmanii]|nr:hypothetical protein [Geminocystis herdmanii]
MYTTEVIKISVTPQVAKAYQSATEKEKQRLSSIESPYFDGKDKIDFELK